MGKYTPMMQQYLDVKENYQDAIVFYRLGDFYEMFFEDAKVASVELDLVLTGRNAGQEEKVPMCGVPHHAAQGYIQKLVSRGYKVAIVEQLEDPATCKGIVKRDVIRVVTPGTVLDEIQDEKSSVYLASLVDYQYGYALCLVEMSTGENYLLNIASDLKQLKQVILKYNVLELVVQDDFSGQLLKYLRQIDHLTISFCKQDTIAERYLPLCEKLTSSYDLKAYGLMLNYLEATSCHCLDHLQIVIEAKEPYLMMDYATIANLELVKPLRLGSKNETLWSFLDDCQTAMGSRLLKKWVEQPLVQQNIIEKRLDQVTFLVDQMMIKDDLKENLKQVYDVQRLIVKVALEKAQAVDCLRIKKTLAVLPTIKQLLNNTCFTNLLEFSDLADLYELLNKALIEDAPLTLKDGKIFKEGYNEQLDQARLVSSKGKQWIVELVEKEKARTGIKNLKVGYNRVFGYYIEISKAASANVQDDFGYIRKQTLTNAERFISKELKEREDEILHAEERAIKLEQQLFQQLLRQIKQYLPQLQIIAQKISELDCLYALSSVSLNSGYIRPEFASEQVEIIAGRHPILDQMMKDKKYIANDLIMNKEQEVLIITGPNMGGKSTYMRQIALIVILAQIGCYVPCKKCKLPIFDQIFTRIGASDDILSGQSTFMVEMMEANNALVNATKQSLVLFDEIGRGTSTYDGMAIAQAMIEYLASIVHAKTLFSTHYHELTSLSDNLANVANVNVKVHEKDEEITFMYQVIAGKADRSYGINVARLANLPTAVLERATDLLKQLESKKRVVQQSYQIVEMEKVDPNLKQLQEMIQAIDPNNLTPLQALQMLSDLKKVCD